MRLLFQLLEQIYTHFSKREYHAKTKKQKLIKVKAPLIDEISGLAIIKIDGSTYGIMLFMHNTAMLDIVNNGPDTITFKPEEMLGILDLRYLGYYKTKQGILQWNLSKCYKFERADTLWIYFNKFINILKKEREQKKLKENYPCLDPSDERKYMTDKEILDKYIDSEKPCLMEEEKKEVMEMLYKYKETFSLRDEIGTCPNIEVEINVTDKSPFFIRPHHVKEEDKALIDKEMKHLCYLDILKEGFSAYSSPVMLISRKLTGDKRLVTDFRHLNVRIAKTIWHIWHIHYLKTHFQYWEALNVKYYQY